MVLNLHAQKNDLNLKEYLETSTFRQVWLDPPGDRPKDIRARRCTGEISKLTTSLVSHHLSNSHAPIFRVVYNCSEACCRDFDTERRDENDDRQRTSHSDSTSSDDPDIGSNNAEEGEDSEEEKEKPTKKRKRPTNATCLCDVFNHVSCIYLPGIKN